MYIDSPNWIKKVTINPINKNDNTSCQYSATLTLNHKEITKDLRKLTKIDALIEKYNWEGINYSPEKEDLKKIDKSNLNAYS